LNHETSLSILLQSPFVLTTLFKFRMYLLVPLYVKAHKLPHSKTYTRNHPHHLQCWDWGLMYIKFKFLLICTKNQNWNYPAV